MSKSDIMQNFTEQVNLCPSLTALCIIEKRMIEKNECQEMIDVVSKRIDSLLNLYAQDD
jgi:hypothetical protein